MPDANPPSPSTTEKPPDYQGHHGKTDCDFIQGWAWDKNHPEKAVQVEIFDSDHLIATVTADLLRHDLVNSKVGTGKYGFKFPIPMSLKDGKSHTIRIRISGTTIDLKNTSKVITCSQEQKKT